jgi:hypothetical protein
VVSRRAVGGDRHLSISRAYRYLTHGGLQMTLLCASGAHGQQGLNLIPA